MGVAVPGPSTLTTPDTTHHYRTGTWRKLPTDEHDEPVEFCAQRHDHSAFRNIRVERRLAVGVGNCVVVVPK